MGATEPTTSADVFYSELIHSYLAAHDWVKRDWLEQEILGQLDDSCCRYVLVAAEPGAGKTGMMAALAAAHPDWLRYFIRRDSTTPLSGGDAASMLLRIGHQLAHRRPHVFEPDRLEIVVKQRVGQAAPGSEVVGVRIEDLAVSPFHRTAIKVEQDVGMLETDMIGLDVAHATVERRLLEPNVLQYLALLDPAAVLAEEEPDALIVILVDALDEVFRFRAGDSVLDWLERGPELPPNVRFIISARPHSRLAVLRGARGDSVRPVDIIADSDEVREDVRSFAANLFDDLGPRLPGIVADASKAADGLSRVADGNFAYLNAYARGLRGAAAEGNDSTLRALLEFDALPRGLTPLYAYFLRRLQQEVAALGDLEIRDGGSGFVPAWEGVGQRFLGVLAVARAPLSLDQLVSFGSVRVWRREAGNVLERFVPFLDSVDGAYRLFHASLAEFLTGSAEPDLHDVAVDESEWHLRIVRHYRGAATTWSAVDWAQADDYALLHLAEHMVELGADSAGRVSDLVNPSLREAALDRFLTDLPFRRIVDTALADARDAPDAAVALSSTVFLSLVRQGLLAGGSRLAPGVLGLMTRLGRIREALARCEVMPPSQYRFRCLEAITACAPEQDRGLLGPHSGADGLVAAALEIPETASPIFVGLDRRTCLETASLALAPFDPDRAVSLAAMTELDETAKHQDEALLAAVRSAPPADLPALVDRMAGRKALAAAVAAERTPPGALRDELLERARAHLGSGPLPERIRALAQLAKLAHDGGADDRQALLASLRATATADDGEEGAWEAQRARLDAAKGIGSIDPVTAAALLDAATADKANGDGENSGYIDTWIHLEAARLFAELGQEQRSRDLVNKVLAYERSLGWYGPAADITKAASVVHAFDPDWARELRDEAVALIEPALDSADEFEQSRVEGTLGGMVDGLISWDLERALQIAQRMHGSWISGGPWDSTGGRSSALGMIGLKLADSDPARASDLLAECLAGERERVVIGRLDPAVLRGGLFAPAGEAKPDEPGSSRLANFLAYVENSINYWLAGRDWRFFGSPVEVLRLIAPFPGSVGSTASWAGAVAAAAGVVARERPDAALDLLARIAEPTERLIACAGVADALDATGDERARAVLAALDRAAATLPAYENEIDLDKVSQGPVLAYLNPSARALLEAAVLLPPDAAAKAAALAKATGSWYLDATYRSEMHWRQLLAPIPSEMSPDDVASAVLASAGGLEHHPDDIQADLIRAAASFPLASRGLPQAREMIDTINRAWAKALAEIYALAASPPGGQSLGAACMSMLEGLPDDLGPLHRASLAAQTALLLAGDDADATAAIRAWGAQSVRDTDPLSVLLGLTMLATASPEPDKAALITEALAQGGRVRNGYLRADALADTLGPTLETRDAAVITGAVQQLLEEDWQVLVEGFRRGAVELIDTFGPEVVGTLDAAMRRAQDVINRGLPGTEHFDGVLPPGSPNARPIPLDVRPAADPAQFYPLYLEQHDLPRSLRKVQDARDQGPDPDDFSFTLHDGVCGGFAVWLGGPEDPVWRVVDIRYVFPTEDNAAAYLAERAPALGEHQPVVADAPPVGDSCSVFGGTSTTTLGDASVEMTMFFYVFRIGSVVVKLFAAQGAAASTPLVPTTLVPLAERIVARIRNSGL